MTPPEPSAGVPASTATTSGGRTAAIVRSGVESDHNDGWFMAVELVTATFTWGGIGYLVDRFWLHTYPLVMSIGFVVGFFAGMYLLWLRTSQAPQTPQAAEAPRAGDTTGGGSGAS